MRRRVMMRAWEIRREYADQHDIHVMTVLMGPCLKQAWTEAYYYAHGYRAAMRKYHPDHGGETWQAQLINKLESEKKDNLEFLGEKIAAAIIAAMIKKQHDSHKKNRRPRNR